MELANQVILIPGASRPVGRAIAHYFGSRGAALILPCFDDWPESNEEMAEEFEKAGYTCLIRSCDLTSPEQTAALLEHAARTFGALNHLVNNIERGGMPIVHGSYAQQVNQSQWELELNTTLKAKWNLFQHCRDLLRESGSGSVTNISSIASLIGRAGPAASLYSDGYSAANAGVAHLTRQWAREAAPDIRVNEIMLGLIETRHGEGTRGWSLLNDEQRQALLGHTLIGRTGTVEEVAELVYFIAVRASYMTGSSIVFDGGYRLGADRVPPMSPGVLE
jgi:3-oxoacyl-[acyl-carrier protein] reductase